MAISYELCEYHSFVSPMQQALMNKDLLTMEHMPAAADITKGQLYRDAKSTGGATSVYVYSARFALKEENHLGVNLYWRGGFYMATMLNLKGGYKVIRMEKTSRQQVDKRVHEDRADKQRQQNVKGRQFLVGQMTSVMKTDELSNNDYKLAPVLPGEQ